MKDTEQFGLTNSGDDVIHVPVETKESTLVSTPAETGKPEVSVVKKKRGRKPKVATPVVETPLRDFYCATCRERHSELEVMKVAAGEDRSAIFCPNCQK